MMVKAIGNAIFNFSFPQHIARAECLSLIQKYIEEEFDIDHFIDWMLDGAKTAGSITKLYKVRIKFLVESDSLDNIEASCQQQIDRMDKQQRAHMLTFNFILSNQFDGAVEISSDIFENDAIQSIDESTEVSDIVKTISDVLTFSRVHHMVWNDSIRFQGGLIKVSSRYGKPVFLLNDVEVELKDITQISPNSLFIYGQYSNLSNGLNQK